MYKISQCTINILKCGKLSKYNFVPLRLLVISGPGQMTAVRPAVTSWRRLGETGGDQPACLPTCDHHNNLHHHSHHGTTSSQERCLHQVYCQPAQGENCTAVLDITSRWVTPAKGAFSAFSNVFDVSFGDLLWSRPQKSYHQ